MIMSVWGLLTLITAVFLGFPSPACGCNDASTGEFPWHGSVQINNGVSWLHVCSCVLYGTQKALTAAHCLYSSARSYRIVFGTTSTSNGGGMEQHSAVSDIIMHPNYTTNVPGYPSDLAVLILTDSIDVSMPSVKTILLASGGDTFAGRSSAISGWGTACGANQILQKSNMIVLYNYDCDVRMGATSAVNEGHICVFEAEKPACSIDSGSPMVVDNTLTGIASWGSEPCSGNYPFVFSRISHYRDWIVSVNV